MNGVSLNGVSYRVKFVALRAKPEHDNVLINYFEAEKRWKTWEITKKKRVFETFAKEKTRRIIARTSRTF